MLQTITGVVAGIDVAALGFALLFFFFRDGLLKGLASLKWLATEGKIISSKIVTTKSAGRSRRTPRYSPVVEYSYTVDGTTYTRDMIRVVVRYGSESFAREAVEKYPAGTSEIVYFNPKNPAEAVLERGIGGFKVLFPILVSLVFLCYGLYLTLGAVGLVEMDMKVNPGAVITLNVVIVLYAVWALTAGKKKL